MNKAAQRVFLTNDQFAQRAQVSPGTPPKWRMLGFGPEFVKFGRAVRYPLDAVERWERECLRRSTADAGRAA